MEISFESEVGVRDYLDAIRLRLWSRSRLRRLTRNCVIVGAIIFALLYLGGESLDHWGHPLRVIFTLPVFFLPLVRVFGERRHYTKFFHNQQKGLPKRFVTLNDAGCRCADALGEAEDHPWTTGLGFLESRRCFVIPLPSTNRLLIFPKRALTREQVRQVRMLLRAHVPSDPKYLPTRVFLIRTGAVSVVLGLIGYYSVPLWFVRYSTGIVGLGPIADVVPHPLSNTSVASTDHDAPLKPFGCSLTLPWQASTDTPQTDDDKVSSLSSEAAFIKMLRGDASTDEVHETDQQIHEEYLKMSGFNQHDSVHPSISYASPNAVLLHFRNPLFQFDPHDGIDLLKNKSVYFDDLRKLLGAQALSSRFNMMRATLFVHLPTFPYFASPSASVSALRLLSLKHQYMYRIPHPAPIYEFHLGPNRGFQFGDPMQRPLDLQIDLFTPQDRHISYTINSPAPIPQSQLNAIAQSITCPPEEQH